MAFDANNLKSAVTSATNTLWYYSTTADTLSTVVASAYFSLAVSKLRIHDLIMVSASDSAGLRRVTSASGATPVTVTTGG